MSWSSNLLTCSPRVGLYNLTSWKTLYTDRAISASKRIEIAWQGKWTLVISASFSPRWICSCRHKMLPPFRRKLRRTGTEAPSNRLNWHVLPISSDCRLQHKKVYLPYRHPKLQKLSGGRSSRQRLMNLRRPPKQGSCGMMLEEMG